jgi:mRNA-degrading endonuclease RelE of RelBE toxin-antitoxin system
MAYTVRLVRSARRELSKLPRDVQQRIVAAVTDLEQDPPAVRLPKIDRSREATRRIATWTTPT